MFRPTSLRWRQPVHIDDSDGLAADGAAGPRYVMYLGAPQRRTEMRTVFETCHGGIAPSCCAVFMYCFVVHHPMPLPIHNIIIFTTENPEPVICGLHPLTMRTCLGETPSISRLLMYALDIECLPRLLLLMMMGSTQHLIRNTPCSHADRKGCDPSLTAQALSAFQGTHATHPSSCILNGHGSLGLFVASP